MEKFRNIWNYIRGHKYSITIFVFILIIGVIDENNLIVRYSHNLEIDRLEDEISYYRQRFEEDSRMLKEITTNKEALEKVAREKYMMKRADEDIFVFEDDIE